MNPGVVTATVLSDGTLPCRIPLRAERMQNWVSQRWARIEGMSGDMIADSPKGSGPDRRVSKLARVAPDDVSLGAAPRETPQSTLAVAHPRTLVLPAVLVAARPVHLGGLPRDAPRRCRAVSCEMGVGNSERR